MIGPIRLIVCALVALSFVPELASAQEGAAPAGTYGARLKTPARDGFFLEGGMWLTAGDGGGQPWLRLEAGIPLPVEHLSLIVPLMLTREHISAFGFESNIFTLIVAPAARYEWFVYAGKGDVSVHAEAGLGFGFTSIDNDPGEDDSGFRGVFRLAGGGTYTAPFGLMVTLQLLGVSVFFGEGGSNAAYEMSLMAGYRWP